MRLTTSFLAAAVLVLTLTPAVLADSFQFTINSTVQESITNTDNDSFMGIYSTGPTWGSPAAVRTATPYYGNSPFSNISFSVPVGSVVTSAELHLILPSTAVYGTLVSSDEISFSPPDLDNPVHIGPILSGGSSSVLVEDILIDGRTLTGSKEGNYLIYDLSNLLTINGSDGVSSNLEELRLLTNSYVSIDVSSGYNWQGYIGGVGQATIPYELEVTGTYSPVPEPSSIALLGTGLLGLAGFARRRLLS